MIKKFGQKNQKRENLSKLGGEKLPAGTNRSLLAFEEVKEPSCGRMISSNLLSYKLGSNSEELYFMNDESELLAPIGYLFNKKAARSSSSDDFGTSEDDKITQISVRRRIAWKKYII